MAKLDQLEKDVLKAQAKIEQLQAKQAKAQTAVMDDPDNEKAAIEAAAAEMQVKAAEMAKHRAQEAVQAEKRRLYDQEVEDARKKLTDLEAAADKIRADQIAMAKEFFNQFEQWQGLVNEHSNLANKYRITARDLWNLDLTIAGMRAIKNGLDHWKAAADQVDYRKRHPLTERG